MTCNLGSEDVPLPANAKILLSSSPEFDGRVGTEVCVWSLPAIADMALPLAKLAGEPIGEDRATSTAISRFVEISCRVARSPEPVLGYGQVAFETGCIRTGSRELESHARPTSGIG